MAAYGWTQRPLGDASSAPQNLLGVIVAGSLYFAAAQQLTNIYGPRASLRVRFILLDGGIFTVAFGSARY